MGYDWSVCAGGIVNRVPEIQPPGRSFGFRRHGLYCERDAPDGTMPNPLEVRRRLDVTLARLALGWAARASHTANTPLATAE